MATEQQMVVHIEKLQKNPTVLAPHQTFPSIDFGLALGS